MTDRAKAGRNTRRKFLKGAAVASAAVATPAVVQAQGPISMINNEDAPTGRSAGSLAWAGLANTYYWIDQKKGVGGVYATQVLPFADVKSLPLFYAFESAVYGR